MLVWKDANKRKRGRDGPFLKKTKTLFNDGVIVCAWHTLLFAKILKSIGYNNKVQTHVTGEVGVGNFIWKFECDICLQRKFIYS